MKITFLLLFTIACGGRLLDDPGSIAPPLDAAITIDGGGGEHCTNLSQAACVNDAKCYPQYRSLPQCDSACCPRGLVAYNGCLVGGGACVAASARTAPCPIGFVPEDTDNTCVPAFKCAGETSVFTATDGCPSGIQVDTTGTFTPTGGITYCEPNLPIADPFPCRGT
jgi:hypothetical protein